MIASTFVRPIGVVHTSADDEVVRAAAPDLPSTIEVFEPFADALEGIDGFSRLIVLTLLDRIDEEARSTLQVKPRGLLRLGLGLDELPTIGVFACDSPVRPNPIAVSIVRLRERVGRSLHVEGLDVFDGTPVLDLKPYGPDRVVPEVTVPAWHEELIRRSGSRRV
ncbi:MAG TPA: tRNA (N6-threonylcarbamoyladenosine(37)-N6)-methyltransferase TrmO [Actinomycetota bacterium]|nr:tRNA (N6-threonylcarbamoyladenosine(37)-N6)-methyltransferase TrmO [Actinomycetota bacterium]